MSAEKKTMSKEKDTYVKKKKDMNFQSVESMQSVVNVVNEAAVALNDKNRTIKESTIPEVLACAFKHIKEGYSVKKSIPFSMNREKHPKLATMLFIGHSAATAVNAGKVYFTQNPMAINYPQWIAFAKYLYKQLKWILREKPNARDAYVSGRLNEQLAEVLEDVNVTFDEISANYIVVFE